MNRYIIREKWFADSSYNAGSKARNDVDTIAANAGYIPLDLTVKEDHSNGFLQSIAHHLAKAVCWRKALKKVPKDSTVLLQFPVKNHTLFLGQIVGRLKKRNIRTIALVHDLDYIRKAQKDRNSAGENFRIRQEEVQLLKRVNHIIVHNEHMKAKICADMEIPESRVIPLGIFDYLIPGLSGKVKQGDTPRAVIIAGNLSRVKSGYAYQLPASPDFYLYGKGWEGESAGNVHYRGAFLPEELPFKMEGTFGLVWDGERSDTCAGMYGEYLRLNNPHKTSLYLACGIPVIVWKEAAIADYIIENKCGITVTRIDEIADVIGNMTNEEYLELKRNAEKTGRELRRGENTLRALASIDMSD